MCASYFLFPFPSHAHPPCTPIISILITALLTSHAHRFYPTLTIFPIPRLGSCSSRQDYERSAVFLSLTLACLFRFPPTLTYRYLPAQTVLIFSRSPPFFFFPVPPFPPPPLLAGRRMRPPDHPSVVRLRRYKLSQIRSLSIPPLFLSYLSLPFPLPHPFFFRFFSFLRAPH